MSAATCWATLPVDPVAERHGKSKHLAQDRFFAHDNMRRLVGVSIPINGLTNWRFKDSSWSTCRSAD